MKNLDTFLQHIQEKIELYKGYRYDSDIVEDWEKNPSYVIAMGKGGEKDLSNMNFIRKGLENIQLDGFDLRGTDFSKADLTNTNFTGSNLEGANFTGALLVYTDFTDANLSNSKGLETCFDLTKPTGPYGSYPHDDEEFATAKFKRSNLTGVSDRLFEILLEIEKTKNIPPYGLKKWGTSEPITTQGVSIEEFLEGCILPKKFRDMLNRRKKTKAIFGI
jgi:hypothetical protein